MAVVIKQGDAYGIALEIQLNGTTLSDADVEKVEVFVGDGIRKLYPGQITYVNELGCFSVPVTQEETFTLPENERIRVDVRVQFPGGMVLGVIDTLKVKVADAISEEVL